MRKIFTAALAWLFAASAIAQQLPSPTLNNLTVQGQINGKAIPSGSFVGTTDTQTLTNKSIAAPQLTGTLDNARLPSVMQNGSSVYPQFGNAINTTATTTNGSPTINVASAAGIAVGQQAFASFFPSPSIVTNVAGNVVTLSQNATVTNASPVAVRFGSNRWSTTSSYLANTVGAKNMYLGSAALGNGSWMNKWSPGTDYSELSSLFVLSPPGGAGVAAFFGSRSSDNNGSFGTALNTVMLTVIDDVKANQSSWGYYNEVNLVSPTVGYHMNEESSVYSHWPYVATDPYSYNQLGASRNTRLDCGKGSGTPQPCSAALEIIQNGAGYGKGIVFGQDGINTYVDGTKPAIVMATDQALHWFRANNTPAWSIVSTKTAGTARKMTLSDNAMTLSVGTDIASGGHIYGATGAPSLSACGGSPSLSSGSSDTHGTITEGNNATGCVVTFVKAFSNTPSCVVSSPTGSAFTSYATSTTALTIVNASASGNKYSYICMGS